jgi:hypothetical protein
MKESMDWNLKEENAFLVEFLHELHENILLGNILDRSFHS